MEASAFYITLPSNASMDIYPDNTAAAYKIRMPKTMYLRNKYEVALAEIQYPHTWTTFKQPEDLVLWVYNNEENFLEQIAIPHAYYNSIEELVYVINKMIREKTNTAREEDMAVRLAYDPLIRRAKIVRSGANDYNLVMSTGITKVLGLGSAPAQTDIAHGFYTLFVYCSICEPQVVGDYYVQLLRSVSLEGKDGDIITKTFIEPHYVPVNTTKFDTIEINIKNDIDELVSFQSGKVICKLHFRQRAF